MSERWSERWLPPSRVRRSRRSCSPRFLLGRRPPCSRTSPGRSGASIPTRKPPSSASRLSSATAARSIRFLPSTTTTATAPMGRTNRVRGLCAQPRRREQVREESSFCSPLLRRHVGVPERPVLLQKQGSHAGDNLLVPRERRHLRCGGRAPGRDDLSRVSLTRPDRACRRLLRRIRRVQWQEDLPEHLRRGRERSEG